MAKTPFYCDDCSTRNTPDSKYCKECGAQLHVVYQTLALSDYDRIDDPTEQERLTQLLDMAFWHNEAGNTDAAIRACNAALVINSNSTTAHSLLGCLYEKQGDNEKAIEHFENVLALNPASEADRAKLEQLRAGVHVGPVRPSPVYRWIPSVFGTAGFTVWMRGWRDQFAEMRRPQIALLPQNASTPAIAAGCAAVLVIAGGLFFIKPAPQGAANAETRVVPVSRTGPVPQSGANSALVPSLPRPVLMEPEPGPYTAQSRPSIVAEVPHDPFTGAPPAAVNAEPLPLTERNSEALRSPRGGSLRLKALPRLGSVDVPSADQGPLPPAPVSGPVSVEANAPIPEDSDIARHTVVVHRLGGLTEFSGVRPASDEGQNAAPEPPSHIEITVDPAPDTQNSSSGSASASTGGGGSAGSGEALQQSAFGLQQQGEDRQAAAMYEKAISAYQAQIAAGEDRDVAERGLQACQTGLQICRQNQ